MNNPGSQSFADELARRPELNAYRDEMHQAIDAIKAAHPDASPDIERRLDHLWATWDDVVRVSAEYGVDANAPAPPTD